MFELSWDLVWTILNIIILFLLLRKFLFKPVTEHMEKRAKAIEDSIKHAENVNREADELKSKYVQAVEGARSEADGILLEARKKATAEHDAAVDQAKLDAAQVLADATRSIESEKARAVAEAQGEIAGLAVSTARKILAESAGADLDSKLMDRFLEEGATQ